MKFVLEGEVAPKKNSRPFNLTTKHSFPSKRYTAWHKTAMQTLEYLLMTKQIQKFEERRVKISIKFIHGDKLRRDSDNQLSSVLDTLKDAGIITDDCWKYVPKKVVDDDYEKGKPRCEIEIEDLGGVDEFFKL